MSNYVNGSTSYMEKLPLWKYSVYQRCVFMLIGCFGSISVPVRAPLNCCYQMHTHLSRIVVMIVQCHVLMATHVLLESLSTRKRLRQWFLSIHIKVLFNKRCDVSWALMWLLYYDCSESDHNEVRVSMFVPNRLIGACPIASPMTLWQFWWRAPTNIPLIYRHCCWQ